MIEGEELCSIFCYCFLVGYGFELSCLMDSLIATAKLASLETICLIAGYCVLGLMGIFCCGAGIWVAETGFLDRAVSLLSVIILADSILFTTGVSYLEPFVLSIFLVGPYRFWTTGY